MFKGECPPHAGHPQSSRGYKWTLVSPVRPPSSIPDPIFAGNARFEEESPDHDPGEIVVRDNDSR